MTDLQLTILGAGSAIPIPGRGPSAQFLTLSGRHFLLDCGEGTQVKLRRNHLGFGRINHIFISHLHGDHFFGLVPLLTSLHLLDRYKEMHLYGPAGLEHAVRSLLDSTGSYLRYELHFHVAPSDAKGLLYEDEVLKVESIPLKHSVTCLGYYFAEKTRPRKMRKDFLEEHAVPVAEIRAIKRGADWTDEHGTLFPNSQLTEDPAPPLSYFYCTDTSPLPEYLAQQLGPVDLLYHESTFTEEHLERARQTKHTTAHQAARVAEHLKVRKLLLGHYSIRYHDLQPLLKEARQQFAESYLSLADHQYTLKRQGNKLDIQKIAEAQE